MAHIEKKILHIITGLDNGGAEASLYRLCCAEQENCHVVVSLTDRGKYGDLLQNAGVAVSCLEMPKGRLTWHGLYRLWRLIGEIKPDVVQTWMYHADLIGGVVARISGIRAICWGIRHSDVHPIKTKFSTRLVVGLCAKISRWIPAKIVCCANNALEVHRQLGYPSEKCVVIPNGYDLDRFSSNPVARQHVRHPLGIEDTMPLFGMVARYDPQKDHANLIQALAILKNQGIEFRCVLVGNGVTVDNRELFDCIDKYAVADNLILLGPRHDVADIMNAIDVHVLSSAYGEAFPNVIAEAMACGTPCVATDVGDSVMIVGDTGWIVKPQDSDALACALIQALTCMKNQADWSERKKRCRNRIIENFSIEKNVQAYRTVWRDAQMCAGL